MLGIFSLKSCFISESAKLESELKTIQTQNQQKLEEQSKELQSLQESIMAIVCHIEKTRQRLE